MPRRAAVLVGALLGALLLLPGSASAGGPTSVLLASPGADTAAGLYYSDQGYGVLWEALDVGLPGEPAASEEQPPGGLTASPGGTQVNVTWLVHDVHVWRIDHVFPYADGGPWIQTYVADADGEIGAYGKDGVWHRSSEPEQLRWLLNGLGFGASTAAANRDGAVPPSKQKAEKDAEPAASSGKKEKTGPIATTGSSGGPPADTATASPWWWAAAALVAGVALGVLGRPAAADAVGRVRRWRDEERAAGPRHQLIDR